MQGSGAGSESGPVSDGDGSAASAGPALVPASRGRLPAAQPHPPRLRIELWSREVPRPPSLASREVGEAG